MTVIIPCYFSPDWLIRCILNHSVLSNLRVVELLDIKPKLSIIIIIL